ncbi:hypothetical protein MRX96_042522 [Rhipicephalus microplus]
MAEPTAKAKAGHGSRRGFSRLLGGRALEEGGVRLEIARPVPEPLPLGLALAILGSLCMQRLSPRRARAFAGKRVRASAAGPIWRWPRDAGV